MLTCPPPLKGTSWNDLIIYADPFEVSRGAPPFETYVKKSYWRTKKKWTDIRPAIPRLLLTPPPPPPPAYQLFWDFDVSAVSRLFRKVNKQPGMQKLWNWCPPFQEIYDWISPLNKRAGSAYISNTVVYGENEYMVNLVTCLKKISWST